MRIPVETYTLANGLRVILSEDAVLDAGDIELGRVLHKEGLPKGETYREAGVYTLPIDAAGDFTIFVTADSDFAVFEGLKEPNNSAHTAAPMHVTLRPVPNLHVATIDVPAAAQPDQRVRLSWTVENMGAGIAIGPWTDQVYLSADGSLTGATLLASVQHDGGMIPGASYKAFADVTLPRVADGALPGTVRAELLARGAVQATILSTNDIAAAEAAAITNAIFGVRPVHLWDGRALATDHPRIAQLREAIAA